ncbi:MAG: hypothetical protein IJN94_03110 [Clostridia bacterium]|nr:hypothetical protein [Clostridia bacterium]
MKCPKCNKEIGRFELSPNCKHCGVNIFYAQQEVLLTEDAKRCELEYATFHILTAKLKNAFIGGKIQIMRIVAMVLAIGAIFVPFATVEAGFSLFTAKFSFGAFGIYQAFTDGTLQAVLNMSTYAPELTASLFVLLALIVLIFLSGFGVFAALILSFINIQKSAKKAQILSLTGIVFSVFSLVLSLALPKIISDIAFINAKFGVGSIACIAVLVLIFVLNRLIVTKNIQPEIKDIDLQRVEIKNRIKKGEITYADLPLPVLESEEEKEKRLREKEEKEALVQSAKGEGK